MKNPLDVLVAYVPTGTAEGERHILNRAFVQVEEYADLVTPPPYSPRLLIGKKGSGKSALIEFSMRLLQRARVPALLLKPMDIDTQNFREEASVGELTRNAYAALLSAVAGKLGSSASGLIVGEDKILYEEAVRKGDASRDAVELMANFLPKIAKAFTKTDLSDLLPNAEPASINSLQSAIAANLAKTSRGFYLFIDDTDQIAAPDRPGHLNRIWAFLLAARELTSQIAEVRCVISMREEIWRRLTSDRAGQRDQTDHFQNLIRHLNPTRAHINEIISRRINLAADELGFRGVDPWEAFFYEAMPRMPSSEVRTSWPDLIVVRSRERPRDAVQLVNGCCQRALLDGKSLIDEGVFAEEMKEFSKARARLLAQEVEFDCPEMEEILRSLADVKYDHSAFKATAEIIRRHISSLGGGFSVTLHGRTLNLRNDEDVFALWRFLFDTGVLNARIADSREKDGYRHVFPLEDPTLVTKARWNEMQAIVWEISPAYRDYLINVQQDKEAQFGLPPRGRRGR